MLYVFAISIQKNPECKYIQDKEVTGGFEPPVKVLQTCALPLGYVTKENITKYDKFHNTISKWNLSIKMTPTRFELVLPPWKGDVLTAWPRSQVSYRSTWPVTIIGLLQAPQVGLEPTTSRLTAVRSTIELLRNVPCRLSFVPSKPNTDFQIYTIFIHFGQALDLLVHISWIPYGTYTLCLSTSYSPRGLTYC